MTSPRCRRRRTRAHRRQGGDWKNLAGEGDHPTAVAPTRRICMPRVGKRRRRTPNRSRAPRAVHTSPLNSLRGGGRHVRCRNPLQQPPRQAKRRGYSEQQSLNQSATTTFWTSDNNSHPQTNRGHKLWRETVCWFRSRINRCAGNRLQSPASLNAGHSFGARSRDHTRG